MVVWWPCIGKDALRYSLYLSPNVFPDSPMYSLSQSIITFAWTIKESIYIRVSQATPNRNSSKYVLLYMWDGILINTQWLQFKHIQHLQVQPISLTSPRIYKGQTTATSIQTWRCWVVSPMKACLVSRHYCIEPKRTSTVHYMYGLQQNERPHKHKVWWHVWSCDVINTSCM